MMWLLEHKKIVAVAFAGAALVGGAYVVSGRLPERASYNRESSETEQTVTLRELSERDTDGDGIKNWEEALWGTDPENGDTDGDGTPDASEIATLRQTAGFSEVADSESAAPLTDTDLFARELFTATLALKESGQLTDTSVENLAAALLDGFATVTLQAFYTEKDLVLGQTTTKETYKKALSVLFQKYAPYKLGSELTLIAEALQSEDEGPLAGLKNYASRYEKLAEDTIKLSVPIEVAPYHLVAANSYRGTATALMGITHLLKNPIAGFASLMEYISYGNQIETALSELERYFKE